MDTRIFEELIQLTFCSNSQDCHGSNVPVGCHLAHREYTETCHPKLIEYTVPTNRVDLRLIGGPIILLWHIISPYLSVAFFNFIHTASINMMISSLMFSPC